MLSFLSSPFTHSSKRTLSIHDCKIASIFNEMYHSYIEVQFLLGYSFPFNGYCKFSSVYAAVMDCSLIWQKIMENRFACKEKYILFLVASHGLKLSSNVIIGWKIWSLKCWKELKLSLAPENTEDKFSAWVKQDK